MEFKHMLPAIMGVLGMIAMFQGEPIASGCFWIASATFYAKQEKAE